MFKHLAPALLLPLAIAGVAAPALAAAADEPSTSQIYQAAEAGRFSDANAMSES